MTYLHSTSFPLVGRSASIFAQLHWPLPGSGAACWLHRTGALARFTLTTTFHIDTILYGLGAQIVLGQVELEIRLRGR